MSGVSARYDVVVIGGGIHGVGVAQAAAAGGYSVLVLEQGELAGGTSSRSSKLIHGGLRYLEHGQFGLVRECLHERNLLLKLAPDLVKLRPFFIPVFGHSNRHRLTIRAGLFLYALLAGGGSDARFKSLSRQRWDSLDGLQLEDLRAVFQYYDAQTDDAALTRSVMASAQSMGAELLLKTEFLGAHSGGHDDASEVYFKNDGVEQTCLSRVIVNAGGPWVNRVLARTGAEVRQLNVELVQGAHVLLQGKLERGIYYLESPRDRRPVFAIPWAANGQDVVMVGTTETAFTGSPDCVQPLADEQEYLEETYHHYFPLAGKERVGSFAGLRVLPVVKTPVKGGHGSRSRDTILYPDRSDRPRLVSIYGGKLTAYRATAEKVMGMLRGTLAQRRPVADTSRLSLKPVE